MANLTPMYYWQDRAEWLVLEALQCACQPDGWARIIPAWEWWQTLCQESGCAQRGQGVTSFCRKLEKLRVIEWLESRHIPTTTGQRSRGGKLVEWRIRPGLKVGLYRQDMAEAGIRWIET